MKSRLFKRISMIVVTMFLCVLSMTGCQRKKGNEPNNTSDVPPKEEYVQLLSFESYEEITGTKLRMENEFGKLSVNQDETYVTEGRASMKVEPQGDYSNSGLHPYLQFDCSDSSIATRDFSNMENISLDVYNSTEEELHISVKLTTVNVWIKR